MYNDQQSFTLDAKRQQVYAPDKYADSINVYTMADGEFTGEYSLWFDDININNLTGTKTISPNGKYLFDPSGNVLDLTSQKSTNLQKAADIWGYDAIAFDLFILFLIEIEMSSLSYSKIFPQDLFQFFVFIIMLSFPAGVSDDEVIVCQRHPAVRHCFGNDFPVCKM